MKDLSGMTELSRYMYRTATSRRLSLKGALALLRENAHVRTTKDILMRFSGLSPEEEGRLQAHLCAALEETSSELSHDSLRRKVSIWIKDNGAILKPTAIQLAFALHLSYEQADEMLKLLGSEGFHWRDPEDIVFGYALLHSLSYGEACALRDSLRAQGLLDVSSEAESVLLTDQIKGRAQSLASEEALRQFLQAEQQGLGRLHNTAYSIFTKYLELLQNPTVDPLYEAGLSSEAALGGRGSDTWHDLCTPDAYSIREILSVYLHEGEIPRETRPRRGSGARGEKDALVLSALQKNIRAYWPDEITLSKMKNRLTDVTRKVLILLFVAVDGYEETEYDEFEEEMSVEEQFEDMHGRLNQMLQSCGFASLDPRVPFDWMILFCICSGNRDFIDARIERFLHEVFSDVPEEAR